MQLERNSSISPTGMALRPLLVPGTLMSATPISIPVYTDANGFNAELAGFRIEARDPEELGAMARPVLEALINLARLPTYVFVARRSRQLYPVYTVGDEVLATTPGGPVFRHVELARVRAYLKEYLHLTGVIGRPGLSDRLHVRGIDPVSLELVRPRFYLKKRGQADTDFWAPVFQSATTLYTYAASRRHEAPLDAGREVLTLHSSVAAALAQDGRLRNPFDVRPDRLMPELWDQLKAHCTPDRETITIADQRFPIYHYAKCVIGVEQRNEAAGPRPGLYLATTVADLEARISADLERRARLVDA